MMGQELFEKPQRQYELYGITAHLELGELLPDPAVLESEDAELTEEQADALEAAMVADPEGVLTFDEMTGVWITGTEDNVNRLFADREEFVDALESGIDPEA